MVRDWPLGLYEDARPDLAMCPRRAKIKNLLGFLISVFKTFRSLKILDFRVSPF